MLIISVFFVAASKIMTQRPSKASEKSPHGFFECYYKGGSLYTHSLKGNAEIPETRAANCNFQPPAVLSFINVHYVSSGGKYLNSQEPLFERRVEIARPYDMETQFYPQCFPDTYSSCSAMFKPITEFKNYLYGAYQQSKIYKTWLDQGTPPANVIFISW